MTGDTATARPRAPGHASAAQRWLARLSLAVAAAAVLVMLAVAGAKSLVLVAAGVGALVLTAAGAWWALTHRGVLRLLAATLVLVPAALLSLYVVARLAWLVGLTLGLWALALATGRAALRHDAAPGGMPEHDVPPPRRPFLIMNPRSGGGKVARFGLVDKARALGAEVALLEGPGTVDVAKLARKAVAGGADLLGVAGGDGTQALVAGVAAEQGIPLLVIAAGTRNHFALDLGLDREDPSRCLDALTNGVELRVDLRVIGGRPFVNNASFGHRGPRLRARTEAASIEGPQAVLVSNNPYGMGDLAGLGRRPRLDGGALGVVAVTVHSAVQAAGLLRGRRGDGLVRLSAGEVMIDADASSIPVGVDGEALALPTPVRCTVRHDALRVRVPRRRPGVPLPKPTMDWRRLVRMAATVGLGH